MLYLPKTKKFNGQTFSLHNEYLVEKQAQRTATNLREQGWRVRIAKVYGMYGVYKRR